MRDRLLKCIQSKGGFKDLSISTKLELTTECTLRCHSHARREVLDFSTRRLTAVYIGLNSFWALIIGYLFALLIIIKNKNAYTSINWCNVLYLVPMVIILLCALLLWNAYIAANEHWELLCKFIEWDVKTNQQPETKQL